MQNSRDLIVKGKRRYLYLAAAVAIVEEEKKRLEEQEKAILPKRKKTPTKTVGQRMVDQTAGIWTV